MSSTLFLFWFQRKTCHDKTVAIKMYQELLLCTPLFSFKLVYQYVKQINTSSFYKVKWFIYWPKQFVEISNSKETFCKSLYVILFPLNFEKFFCENFKASLSASFFSNVLIYSLDIKRKEERYELTHVLVIQLCRFEQNIRVSV